MQFEEARDVLIMIDDLARTPRFRSAATLSQSR